jgi:L-alanine-DL-glutamate epimerase-like enolase superfamily enzyme
MADEALFTPQDAYALAEARAVDAFCISYKLGGIRRRRRLRPPPRREHPAQLRWTRSAVATRKPRATSRQHAGLAHDAAEFVFGLNATAHPLCPASDFVLRDGHVDAPRGPVLGITTDEALKKNTPLTSVWADNACRYPNIRHTSNTRRRPTKLTPTMPP